MAGVRMSVVATLSYDLAEDLKDVVLPLPYLIPEPSFSHQSSSWFYFSLASSFQSHKQINVKVTWKTKQKCNIYVK